MKYYVFDWDWEFAVSLALFEAADRDVEPGRKVGEVTTRIRDRAREIYNRQKTSEAAGTGNNH